MSQKVQIVFDAKMDVANLKSGLQQFQTGLASLSMPKNMGAELEKRLNRLNSEIRNFESLSEKAGNSLDNAGKINSSYGKIAEYARQLEITFKRIGEEAGIDASKFFPKEIITKIEGAEKAMENYQEAVAEGLKGLKDQVNEAKKLEQILDKAKKDLSGAKKTQGLKEQRLTGAKARQAQTNAEVSERQGKIDTRKKEINARTEAINKEIEAINKRKKALQDEETAAKNNLKTLQDKSNTSVKQETKDKYAPLIKEQTKAWNEAKQAKDNYINSHSTKQLESELESLTTEVKSLETAEKGLTQEQNSAARAVSNAQNAYDTATDEVTYYENELKKAEQASTSFNTALENQKKAVENSALQTLIQELEKIGIAVDPAVTDLQGIEKTLNKLQPQALDQIEKALEKAGTSLKDFNIDLDKLGTKSSALKQTADDAMKMSNQFNDLKNQVQYFFSLTNSVQLLQRAVRSAFETVKELDAAMTETAVVTDFSVGDMWDQLPRYTQAANELGTTTKGAYETMTLFYQQGLDTNEAFAIGTETMKMARIAGLDYANATNLMTAALRGFNMELNETSATRINDVYSELAAITAADTQEIATAMTKTASIAANANMEFETTAALLSQIIETTREPAETAGTAMKTIIARFTEMKKAAGDVINVDGEEVNVNKVEAALKSAGVALRDTKGEFRDLDDVFLELSSKWNNLDMMTQRYVATMAAGSRQQSRFIAMMSDYDRTLELVDAAYNSSGASQRQFEKTQDSLESKLNKLTNAWNEFLMGISNSSVIKGAVDLLTNLLNIINKVTGAFGEGAGGVLKLATAMGGLKLGSAILNKGLKKAANLAIDFQKGNTQKSSPSFLQGLTQRVNNLKTKNAFVVDARLDTKSFKDKLDDIKKDFGNLRNSVTEKIQINTDPNKAILGFQYVDDAIAVTAMRSQGASEIVQIGLSEVGNEAIQTALKADGVGDEIVESGMEGKVALDILQKEYDELMAKAAMAQAMADKDNLKPEARERYQNLANKRNFEAKQVLNDMEGIKTQGSTGTQNALVLKIKQLGAAAGKTVASFAPLAPILLGIASAIGIIAAAWYFDEENVLARQVKEAKETVDGLEESLSAAKTKLNDLSSSKDSLASMETTLSEMTAGTNEWKQQLMEVNSQVMQLISKYPELAQYMTNENGKLGILDSGWEKIIEKQKQQVMMSSATTMTASAELQQLETQLDVVEKRNEAIKDIDSQEFTNWDVAKGLGGAGRTALGGALGYFGGGILTGAIAGSIAGPLGAIIGAAVGSIGGAIAGLAAGGVSAYKKGKYYDEKEARESEEFNNYDKSLDYERQAAMAYKKSSYSTALGQYYSTDYGLSEREDLKAISDLGAENFDRILEEEKKKIGIGDGLFNLDGANKEEIKEWAEYSGYTKKGNKYYDSEGNEIDTKDNEAIALELAQYRAMERSKNDALLNSQNIDTLNNLFKNTTNKNKKIKNTDSIFSQILENDISTSKQALSSLLDQNGKEINNIVQDFRDSFQGNDEEYAKALSQFLNLDIKTVSKDLDKYTLEFQNKLQKSAKQLQESQKNFAKTLSKDLTKDLGNQNSINIEKALNSMESDEISAFSELRTLLSDNVGDKAELAFSKQVIDLFNNANIDSSEIFSEFQNAINNIDFSNPITAASQFKAIIDDTGLVKYSEEVKGIAKSILEAGDAAYSTSGQFKFLLSSSSFEDTQKEITKLVKKNGELTADNIIELAEECQDLKTILSEDVMSANALAFALTGLEKGTVSIEGLTSAVLDAVSATNNFNTILKNTKDFIDNFDDSFDSDMGIDFLTESSEALKGLIEGKEYGNPLTEQYLNMFYGKDALEALNPFSSDYNKKIEEMQEKMTTWTSINGKGFWTEYIERSKKEGNELTGYITSSGSIALQIGKQTTDEIITQLSETMDISKEAAAMFWETYISRSAAAKEKVAENDTNKILEDFYKNAQQNTEKGKIATITSAEIEAMAQATGKSYEYIYNKIVAENNKRKDSIKIVEWLDTNIEELDGEELLSKLKDKLDFKTDNSLIDYFDKIGAAAKNVNDVFERDAFGQWQSNTKGLVINLETAKEELARLGIEGEAAEKIIDELAAKTGATIVQEVEISFVDENGITQRVSTLIGAANCSQLTTNINEALTKADTDSLSAKLANSLKNQSYTGFWDKLKTGIMGFVTALATAIRTGNFSLFGTVYLDYVDKATGKKVTNPTSITAGTSGNLPVGYRYGNTNPINRYAPKTIFPNNNSNNSNTGTGGVAAVDPKFTTGNMAQKNITEEQKEAFSNNAPTEKPDIGGWWIAQYDEVGRTDNDVTYNVTYEFRKVDPIKGEQVIQTETKTVTVQNKSIVTEEDPNDPSKPVTTTADFVPGNEDTDKDKDKDTEEEEEEYEPINPIEYNAQQGLTGLEYDRYINSREEELIGKLPSEFQGPLQLANLGEKMYYEAQEIGYNQQLADVYRNDMAQFEAQAAYKDYYAFDENSMTYQYNDKFMQEYKTMDPEKRQAIDEEIAAANEVATKFREVAQELEGGKIQKAFGALEKSSKSVSKILKKEGNTANKVNDALNVLEDKLGLNDKAFDKFGNAIGEAIDGSKLLNERFEGLGDVVDKIEDGPLGKMLGESAKPVFELLKNGGTNREMGSALFGMGGDMFGNLKNFANFDMLGMGLDGMNMMKGMMDQGKQMMEQAAQYICQAIQVVVDAITNREDILFNYLNLIEKELQNYEKLQRYSTQLEKGRLASSEDIALNWDAQWESLQKQLEMQEFRVEQRQQQLEMSRWIPFQLISGWDPTSDTLYENREVKFAWDLLIGFGQMMPMFGQVFGSLNQLYEDYDKRVTEAYEDRLEAEQAILDIQDERLELVKVGSEEATEFEEKILEALVQKEQEAIDELTSINESITDANSKLLSTLQDKLDKIREQRENEKMEEELGEKERRLAYFRQNTGQGKLMDIKKLEEELEQGHESYTDQLIDQRIADLERQNEKAAEQREKQIDLMQAQLDWSEKYGLYWDQIYGMLYVINDDGTVSMNLDNFDLEGNLRTNGELSTLLNTFSDNIGKSIWSQLLENEELMRLGRYYQAFISRNGVTGEWGKYWALLDPGQDDPASAYVNPWDSRDVGFILKGIVGIENAINKYFILSDYGLANMAGRIEAAFKNTIGKLFGIEEWANYEFTGYRADHMNTPVSDALYKAGAAIGIYEKEPDNSTYKSHYNYGNQTGSGISTTEKVKDTMFDIDLYIGEIFDSADNVIDSLTGFFADLFQTWGTVL